MSQPLSNKFIEEDVQRFTAALNFIAKEGKFGDGPTNVPYSIELRNHFAYLQGVLGKIEANIAEIKSVQQVKKAEPETEKKKSKAAK